MNTTEIGNQTEGMVMAAILRSGKAVLLPFGGGLRYDLVYDDDGRLVKVQCKTGRYRNGAIEFRTYSVVHKTSDTPVGKVNYHGQIDEFGVYSPELGTVYLVPIAETGAQAVYLRVDPAKNNQAGRVRWAKDYLI